MSAISDITVTYGSALAPAKYHRIVTLEGHGADVNKGNGPPVYLWSKDRTNKEPAIVDISVIYDGEDVPEGFEKVSKTLLKGVDRQAYICVKKSEDPDVPAVGKILILYGDEQLPGGCFGVVCCFLLLTDPQTLKRATRNWSARSTLPVTMFTCIGSLQKKVRLVSLSPEMIYSLIS